MGRDSKSVNYSDRFILYFRRTLGAVAILFVILFIAEFAYADIVVSPESFSPVLIQGCGSETDPFFVTNVSGRGDVYQYTFAYSPWMVGSLWTGCDVNSFLSCP